MTPPNQKQLTLYGNLMEEVKFRFDCVNRAANGSTGLPAPIVREFLYLQIRFLCELIALGCLVAHGDIASLQSHKIGRSYSADEILDRMERLRPHFYPIAVKQTLTNPSAPPGQRHHDLRGIDPSPLPKAELIAIYGKTHKHLHRGSLKKLLSAETPLDMTINVPDIVGQVQKMSNLLSNHIIAINEKQIMMCMLINVDNNNRVQVATGEKREMQQ